MKILNFGSLNVDYTYHVDHFVTPGETMSSQALDKNCGGKGLNQSVALAKAGAEVYHGGKIGADGQFLVDMLKQSGVNTDYVSLYDGASGHAIIQVDKKGQNCIILYGGANQAITLEDVDRVLAGFEAGDFLLLQNEISNLDAIVEKAAAKGMKIALNPSPINEAIDRLPLDKIDYFILNEIEGNQLSGKTDAREIVDTLKAKYPRSTIVLTLGKHGVLYYDGKNSYTHGIYDVPVVDTTAAGDTFTGFLLACLTQNYDVPTALELASKASSLAVSKKGAAGSIPTMQEVKTTTIKPC